MSFENWAAIFGDWGLGADEARYLHGTPHSGLLLGPDHLNDGEVRVRFSITESVRPDAPETDMPPGARLVFGYDIRTLEAFSAGVGSSLAQFVIERFAAGEGGWSPFAFSGATGATRLNHGYDVRLRIVGQRVLLVVDGVPVQDANLPVAPTGYQLGLMAWGSNEITFSNFTVSPTPPHLFVVMQFGQPYDDLYTDVIKPVGEAKNFQPIRADDVPGPGVILADIMREIREASAVVAEISARNPNVFYEVGYAHAVGTPTILLVRRGESLPFDVSGFRCIVYDDSIGGKRHVENELRKHLDAIAAGRAASLTD